MKYDNDSVEKILPAVGLGLRALGTGIKAGAKKLGGAGKALAAKKIKDGDGLDIAGAVAQAGQNATAQAQQNKQNQIQGAMDASRKHAEISTNTGSTMKSPMDSAWWLLKNEMRFIPSSDMEPNRESLLSDLKNFGGGNRVLENEDKSLSLENIHDDDMDIIERLAATHGHERQLEEDNSIYQRNDLNRHTDAPHFFTSLRN